MEKAAAGKLLNELGATLERARKIFDALQFEPAGVASADASGGASERVADATGRVVDATGRVEALEGELSAGERDREELTARLVEAEHQLGRLMNLYVATFQLHATLDPSEVQATIAEIAVDLLGAERFVLLLRSEGTNECEVALSRGLDQDPSGLYGREKYLGGDPLVDAALEDGVLRMGPEEFSDVIAAVPLRVQDAIVGVLVVLKLFDHKTILRAEDRDLLDLLAAHAASALFAARVYSNTDRKLRTLESLVQLVRST